MRPYFLHLYRRNLSSIQQTTFHIQSLKTHFKRRGLSLLRAIVFIGTTLLLTYCQDQVQQTDNSKEGPSFQIADSTKTRLKSEFIAMYKTYTDSFNQEEAEKMAESFLQDFIEKKKQYGDSLSYFSDIYVGFGNSFSDTVKKEKPLH